MRFSDFAIILFRIQGGQKYAFTRELLSTGLDTEGRKIVAELPDNENGRNRLRKYLAGTRNITEIAVQIQPHFEKRLFMECMEDWEDHYEKICTEFGKAKIHIEIEDVPQRLAEIYHGILLQTATGLNQEPPAPPTASQIPLSDSAAIIQPTPKSQQETQEAVDNIASWKVLEQDRNAIADILKRIHDKLGNISKRLSDIPIWYQLSSGEREGIRMGGQNGLSELVETCKELQFYSERYPQYSDLLVVIQRAKQLDRAYTFYFYPNDTEGEERFAADYESFEKALQKCSQSIVYI